MLWLVLAFLSATLLGFYDVFKKLSLKENAVLPVLFLNTFISTLIFAPFILSSYLGWLSPTSIFYVPPPHCQPRVIFYSKVCLCYPLGYLDI